ncbi:P-loop NTPase family protein, partial [Staphylococcus epidermidis]
KIHLPPTENQIHHLLTQIQHPLHKHQPLLLTTLTKRITQDLTTYIKEAAIKLNYLHSQIKTLQPIQIIPHLPIPT